MTTRNNTLALIFLTGVLAFMIFAAKRLLYGPRPAPSRVDALLEKAKPVVKPSLPKPSAAVPAQPSPAASSSPAPSAPVPSSSPVPSSKGQERVATSAAGGASAATPKAPSPAAKSAATPTEDHHPDVHRAENHRSEDRRPEDHRAEDHRPQLRVAGGVPLWIRVTAISRKADGSFTFRGTLLQPVTLANSNQLDQGTALAGSGKVGNGHVTVLVSGFTVGGANYALLDASGSGKRPGTGLAVELDPGKLLEVWLAAASVYRKTP